MGRTSRRRRRRKKETNTIQDELLLFQKWIHSQGWKPIVKLKFKNFPDTGHGLMTVEHIHSGDTLVKIPPELLITAKTISETPVGEIFKNSDTKVSIQLVFTAFIIHERHLGALSFWNNYVSILPNKFTSPLFCSDEELNALPEFIVDSVIPVKRTIEKAYNTLQAICGSICCTHCSSPFTLIFSSDIFLWAWFAVNSRVVFISPSENFSHDLPLSDSNSIALAPYLDMLNHSNKSQVVATFSPISGYELKTLIPFKKYEQVFIHYGSHDNIKLFVDYGFIIPENEHDVFMLNIKDITEEMKNYDLVDTKLSLIQKHCPEFLKDLYLSKDGLSWNCKVLIYLFSSTQSNDLKTVLINVYFGKFEERCSCLKIIAKEITEKKIKQFEGHLKKLSGFEGNNILIICRKMLDSYLKILKGYHSSLT